MGFSEQHHHLQSANNNQLCEISCPLIWAAEKTNYNTLLTYGIAFITHPRH
jgi:hypothetical protein